MSVFGDADPEDAYDAGDPIDVRLGLLRRVVLAIETDPDFARRERRRFDVARLLHRIADELTDGR